MKKIYSTLVGVLLTASVFLPQHANAQAPEKMSYQAVVRDASNNLITATSVGMQVSVLQGSSTGTPVYVETQTPTTNDNGLATMEIGDGTVVSGSFAAIDWANGPYFIKTETDPTGGTNYTIAGTSELLSVPYALFSANGTPGATGSAGPPGAPGPQGPTGADGAAGAQGPTGADGAAGAQGPTGADGAVGAQGPTGADGAVGAQGPTGADGAVGAQGPTGADGAVGAQGPTGADGAVGAQGPTGADGADGAAGPQGATGPTVSGWLTTAGGLPSTASEEIYRTANVGIGAAAANPAFPLDVRGTGGQRLRVFSEDGVFAGYLSKNNTREFFAGVQGDLETLNAASGYHIYDNTAAAQRMVIDMDGNLGINQTDPTAKLEVNGTFKLVDGSQGVAKVLTSDADGLASWQTPSAGGGFWTLTGDDISNSNAGNVGIGVANPRHMFEVGNTDTTAAMAVGHIGGFNTANSGVFKFSEDLDFASDCGIMFQHNGDLNNLYLTGGCPAPDTIARFNRSGFSNMRQLRLGLNYNINPTTQLSVDGNSDFTGTMTITGDLNVTGNISKGGGTFKIDHPLDPANKYLVHSFVESPEMMNIYSGNISTDANGYATVEMPSYFEAANKDFRYQLTVIGTFAQAIVKEKISNNSFVIQTNQPNTEVSWSVTGVRADKYADENRVVAEQEKELKGTYIHPELYGASKEDAENVRKAQIELNRMKESTTVGADGQ